MEVLRQKPDTKRPAIVAAATSLFASKGADATSMRDVADDAGVCEAAIYRHFRGKEEMAQEIFASWYGWYSRQVQEIVKRGDSMQRKLRALVHAEFDAVRAHPQEFLYFARTRPDFCAVSRAMFLAFGASWLRCFEKDSTRGRSFGECWVARRHAGPCAVHSSNLGDSAERFADFGERRTGSRQLLANDQTQWLRKLL